MLFIIQSRSWNDFFFLAEGDVCKASFQGNQAKLIRKYVTSLVCFCPFTLNCSKCALMMPR